MTPMTFEEYRRREQRNPKARPITQDPIGAHLTPSEDNRAEQLAARGLTPANFNKRITPRKPTTEEPAA